MTTKNEAPERAVARSRYERRSRADLIARLVDLDDIQTEDLTNPVRTHALYLAAVREGLVPAGDEMRFFAFVAKVERRHREGRGHRRIEKPGGYLARGIRRWRELGRIPKRDMSTAALRLRELARECAGTSPPPALTSSPCRRV